MTFSDGFWPSVTQCSEEYRNHLSLVVSDIIKSNPKKKLSPSTFRGGFCIYEAERKRQEDSYCATGTYKKRVPNSPQGAKWGLTDEYTEREFIVKEPCHPAFIGTWSEWIETGQCSVNSGKGHLIRQRRCLYPPCKGTTTDLNLDLECDNGEEANNGQVCYHNNGATFSGDISNANCIAWEDAHQPYLNSVYYAELTGANCRNPGGVRNAPWCFSDDRGNWQYCTNIGPCQRKNEESVIAMKTHSVSDVEMYNLHMANETDRFFPIGCRFPFLYHGVQQFSCAELLDSDRNWITGHGVGSDEEPIYICSLLGQTTSVSSSNFMICSALDGNLSHC